MEIGFINLKNIIASQNNTEARPPLLAAKNKYPNLSPLKKDTVSFKGVNQSKVLKKSDFDGADLATIEKYRVDISGFKNTEDLQEWAAKKIQSDYSSKNYTGRQENTTDQRVAIMKEWFNYVTKENGSYSPVLQLMILDAVTKDLKPTNDKLPPTLNKGVLADTVCEVQERLKSNPKEDINLNKIYQTKLKALYFGKDENNNSKANYTGWIVIPSKKHDPENFEENVNKLKALSHPNWCTKSFNAEPYLSKGDFHVYLENGEPKLGVRFIGSKIQEIQGARNNTTIPLVQFERIQNYIKDNKFKLKEVAEEEIKNAEKKIDGYKKLKEKIGEEAIKNNDPEKILPVFGMIVKKDSDGKYILNKYKLNNSECDLEDLGVNENEMFKKIKEIKGNADFYYSTLTRLSNLEKIGGNAVISGSKILSLGNLKSVGGNLLIYASRLEDIGKLKYIGGDVNFGETYVESLGDLECIGGSAKFEDSLITSLGKLKEVACDLDISHSAVTDLGELEEVGRNANFSHSLIESLGNLKRIGGNADFCDSALKDLGALKFIGKDADFSYTSIPSTKNLEHIGGEIYAEECTLNEADLQFVYKRDRYADLDVSFDEEEDDFYNESKYDEDDYYGINSMSDYESYLYRHDK